MSRVRRPRVAGITVAAAAIALAQLTGCSGSDGSSPRPSGAPSTASEGPTTLAQVDTSSLVVPRAPFCDRVDPDAARAALGLEPGEEPDDVVAHRSGQRIRVTDDVADVVHEFGCRWTAGDATAQAWVFAPPVTPARARKLVAGLTGRDACATATAPAFGRPSVACTWRGGESRSASYHGLFGDAWWSCSLTLTGETGQTTEDRASAWCAAVLTGVSGTGASGTGVSGPGASGTG